MTSQRANQGPISPRNCGVCLESILDDIAILLPCRHSFHMSCIDQLWGGSCRAGKYCPRAHCDRLIEEVHYDFSPDGQHKTELVRPVLPEPPLPSGVGIERDEELRGGMTEAERSQILAVRRFREAGEVRHTEWLPWVDYAYVRGMNGKRGMRITHMQKLFIEQLGHEDRPRIRVYLVRDSHMKAAKMDAEALSEFAERYGRNIVVWPTRSHMTRDSRRKLGLVPEEHDALRVAQAHARVHMVAIKTEPDRLAITHGQGFLTEVVRWLVFHPPRQVGSGTRVQNVLLLEKTYQIEPPSEDEKPELYNENTRETREKMVRLCREQLQGVVEKIRWENYRGEGQRLDRVEMMGAALWNVTSGQDCYFCGNRHRNGDCLLGSTPNSASLVTECLQLGEEI